MNVLRNVELSGPTLFNPLITEAMKVAQVHKTQGSNNYNILLILTGEFEKSIFIYIKVIYFC